MGTIISFENMIFQDLKRYYMNGYLPKKDVVFFNPGKPGVVFAHSANYYITVEQLLEVQESLSIKTSLPIVYIENRRAKMRRSEKDGQSIAFESEVL